MAAPTLDRDLARALAPQLYQKVFGTSLTLAPSKYLGAASVDAAVAMWKGQPRLRALFESGAGGAPKIELWAKP